MGKKVSVIGAGVAGLASAIRLQHAGYQVTLYEKEARPGGKMNQVKMDGYQFDLGPSIVMMPKVYKEIFELCGRDPDDYIPMEMLDPMYQVYFSDEPLQPMSVSNNLARWTETLESISQADTTGFFNYLDDAYLGFSFAWDHILQRPFRKKSDFYNLGLLKDGMKTKTGRSADQFVSKYIKSERLKQVISFQTLYIGISPVKSPSFYTMIPMLQFIYGIWFIKGGMYRMTKSMEQLFIELGGTVHYKAPVTEILIEKRRAIGIRIENEEIKSDFVVCNADFPYAMKHLVQNKQAKGKYTNKKIDHMEYSCSTLVFYLAMDRKYNDVDHVHNFVFSKDFDKNMQDIFSGNKLTNGSFYVYIASKIDSSLAPPGKDGLYIMMPVSNVNTAKYEWNEETITYYRTYILNTLKTIKAFENIENEIVSETCLTPLDFESKFNAYHGAVFGLLPNMRQSSHLRPQSKANNCDNLYFTGSSVHPGAGVPIVLLSAKIAAQELMHDDQGILFDYT